LTFEEEDEAIMSLILDPEEAQIFIVDPHFWSKKTEILIGLDNVYRFTPYVFEIPMALKGRWTSEEIFFIQMDFIGNTGYQQFQFTFDGEKADMQIIGSLNKKTSINARQEE
jgi:hypothetical protein